jgi:hypothetical protein
MFGLTLWDWLALAWFVGAWSAYSLVIEKSPKGRRSLNALMNSYRDSWMQELLGREVRIVDSQVTGALQNGTAFFASTSLIAVGSTLSLLHSTEQVLDILAKLPFAVVQSPELWELKMIGLPSSSSMRSSSSPGRTGYTTTLPSWSAPRRLRRRKTPARPRSSPTARPGFVPTPDGISTARSARFSSRSVISAGSSGRSSLRLPRAVSSSSCGDGNSIRIRARPSRQTRST